MSIPASQLVDVVPSVLPAGGTALDLVATILTQSHRPEIGTVKRFTSPADVGSYFGLASTEYSMAAQYFTGFTGATKTPAALNFAQYAEAAVPSYVHGASIASLGVAGLDALSGSLSVVLDGHTYTAPTLSFTGVTSFSAAAAAIQAAFAADLPVGGTAPVVSFYSLSGAFKIASGVAGSASTAAFATGTLADTLRLTALTGAVVSQGSAPSTPASVMSGVVGQTTDFATFTTAWEASVVEAVAFAAWTTSTNGRYLYVSWSTDMQNTVSGSTETVAYLVGVNGSNSNGVFPIYAPTNGALAAAFVCGYAASIDFTSTNGRATAAFRGAPGLSPDVTTGAVSSALIANGVNFVGSFSTANDVFTVLYPGFVSGEFDYADSYLNEIWLTNQMQLAIVAGLVASKSVPYAGAGYALILAWLTDPVMQAVDFGMIVPGVALSTAQVAELRAQAGLDISIPLTQQGYYLQVLAATATVRAARSSPPCKIWYLDGGSIQSVSLAAISVQ